MRRPKTLFLFLILLPAMGIASDWEIETLPVPNIVSGTLRPLTIAINEKVVLKRGESVSVLILNGKEIIPSDPSNPDFYLSTGDSKFDFRSKSQDGNLSPIIKLELPRLSRVLIQTNEIVFELSKGATSAKFDDNQLALIKGRGRAALGKDRNWFANVHAVRLFNSSGVGQLYNLVFTEKEKPKQKVAKVEESKMSPATPTLSLVESPASRNELHLLSFSAGLSAFSQARHGSGTSIQVSYCPMWEAFQKYYVRGDFGVLFLKKIGGGAVPILNYQALAGLPTGNWAFEIGGGAQSWLSYGGTSLAGSFNVGYAFDVLKDWKINRWTLGYTALFNSNFTHFLRTSLHFIF